MFCGNYALAAAQNARAITPALSAVLPPLSCRREFILACSFRRGQLELTERKASGARTHDTSSSAGSEAVTAESLGWQLRSALPPMRLHSVSLYNNEARRALAE